ncbi:MAG: hypothetical protein H7338_04130, partial [Candidatus Sericytochromatia bacterium]|nr:hypothetical protein [Candidatus Sericytochromatia bacterium]
DTKGIVPADGSSYINPGPLPVITAASTALGDVGVGSANLAGSFPVSVSPVLGRSMAADTIASVLGTGVAATAANGTPIAAATLLNPEDVVTDPDGNLFLSDNSGFASGRVRMVPRLDGTYYGIPMIANRIYTIVGNSGNVWAGEGSLATATGLNGVKGISLDTSGNLLICCLLRVIVVPKVAGSYFGQAMLANRGYTVASPATIPTLTGISTAAFDGQGNAFFANSGQVVPFNNPSNVFMIPRTDGTYFGQVMTTGTAYAIAGTPATNGYGSNNVLATTSDIRGTTGLAFDAESNVYFTDFWRVRMVPKASGTYFGQSMTANFVYTIAGFPGGSPPSDNAPATAAGTASPTGISLDPAGNLYFGCTTGSNVYMVPKTAGKYYGRAMKATYIYRLAGSDSTGFSGDGGAPGSAQLNLGGSGGVHADGLGVWIADTANSRLRYLSAFDTVDRTSTGLYTFLDQAAAGAQDRAIPTRYLAGGAIAVANMRSGSNLPLMTVRAVNGVETLITLSLTALNNTTGNTAYDNARLIADAVNAKSPVTGVAMSVVRDRKNLHGKVALVLGHVQRTLAEAFTDFTDPINPAADLARSSAGILETIADSLGNRFHRVNILTLTATAPSYRPMPGDKLTFDGTGQLINQSRGATAGAAPPFATGIHIGLVTPANPGGLQKSAGSSRFVYTDAAGRLQTGFAGQAKTSQIGPFGIQARGSSTLGAENTLIPQSLEQSNTSVTDMLPELTIAQKVFTSTSKLISIGNSIVEDLNGLIR